MGKSMKGVELRLSQRDNRRKIAITLKIPRFGYRSVSDTLSLANLVRRVEFELLYLNPAQNIGINSRLIVILMLGWLPF
jgi:hypothetical protein